MASGTARLVVRARYEGGVLRPLEPLELEEGREYTIVVQEDIVAFARRLRLLAARGPVEPGEELSRDRPRLGKS